MPLSQGLTNVEHSHEFENDPGGLIPNPPKPTPVSHVHQRRRTQKAHKAVDTCSWGESEIRILSPGEACRCAKPEPQRRETKGRKSKYGATVSFCFPVTNGDDIVYCLQVPRDKTGGDELTFLSPEGQLMQTVIPPDRKSGQKFRTRLVPPGGFVHLKVPPGLRTGDAFEFSHHGLRHAAIVPPQMKAGDTFQYQFPRP